MVRTYYSEGKSRGTQVQELFASIAGRYDLINDLQSFGLHRYWKRRLLKLAANDQKSGRALDVCCGTGDLTLGLSQLGFDVTGMDFSNPMLEVARRKAEISKASSGSSALKFLHGDAMALPFPDDYFDAVTVGYGLRNLVRWDLGVREMWRVCKPGGRLVCLDFGRPPNAFLRAVYHGYLKLVVPLMGKIFCGNWAAYRYILDSLVRFPAQGGIERELIRLGARKVQTYEFIGGTMAINYAEKP